MLNLPRAGWVLDLVFTPAEWQVQTQSGQRFFNSCGMLVDGKHYFAIGTIARQIERILNTDEWTSRGPTTAEQDVDLKT